MVRFVYLRFSVCGSTAACQKHSFVMKSDIVDNCKFVIRNRLFVCPEQVVCRSHKKRRIFHRVFFVSTQWGIGIFLGDAVKSLDKCFQLRRYRPEQQRGSKYNQVCCFYFGYQPPKFLILSFLFSMLFIKYIRFFYYACCVTMMQET